MEKNKYKEIQIDNIDYKQVFGFIIRSSEGFWFAKLLLFGLPVLWGINASLSPFFAKQIVDAVAQFGFTDMSHVLRPFLSYLIWVGTLFFLFSLDDYYIYMEAIPKIRKKMAMELLGRIIKMDHEFFQKMFSGTLAIKISDAVDELQLLLRCISWGFVKTAVMIPAAVVAMCKVDWQIGLMLFVWAGSFVVFTYFYGTKIAQCAQTWSEVKARNSGKVVDVVSNITTVRFFGGQEREMNNASEFFQEATNSEREMEFNFMIIWTVYKLSYYLFLVFSMVRVLLLWRSGQSTAGDFLMIFQIHVTIGSTFWQIVTDFSQFLRSSSKISQGIKTVLDYKPKIYDSIGAAPLKVTRGKIEFRDVQFNYPGCHEPIFENKTIVIEPGQRVGLVGPSGSGKTTFVNLILRNFDTVRGSVLIDGQDVKNVTLQSLREAISVVSQESILFNRSVFDNIGYSATEVNPELIYDAAKAVRAHDFIVKLENGYDTQVGERGSNLSGGQRQRVSIARAVLKNAPILILDEATSQLDSIVEKEIQASFDVLTKGKTALVIAHRLATIEKMDRIIVFFKGKIVADGTHKELSAQQGLYKNLLEAQKLDYFD